MHSSERQAVIDIGSNSVRLVVYDGPARAPFPICNEKALCGLGRDFTEDGCLNPASVDAALTALTRFRGLLDWYGGPPVSAVATAAVRAAKDGDEFVSRANNLGFDIKIIDGAREAELAALGVISLEPQAEGIIGDMGGGSLELVRVVKGAPGESISAGIGALALMRKSGGDLSAAKAIVEEAIAPATWLRDGRQETLYAVGGAWRSLARIHMRLRDHPLPILHHYEMTAKEAIDICDFVSGQSRQSLQEIPGIARRRIDSLPFAARVLAIVIKRSKVRRMLVSAGGVREGLTFEKLSAKERKQDPLVVGATFMAQGLSPTLAFGENAVHVLTPLFEDNGPEAMRLVRAACAMIDVGAYFHPDLRGLQAYDIALRAPFYGVSHAERAMLALALYLRHEGRRAEEMTDRVETLLSEEQAEFAVRLGLAMRFVASFAPKAGGALEGCSLHHEKNKLIFRGPIARADLFQELPQKRIDALAAAFDATAHIDLS